jgi:hypothetical protein
MSNIDQELDILLNKLNSYSKEDKKESNPVSRKIFASDSVNKAQLPAKISNRNNAPQGRKRHIMTTLLDESGKGSNDRLLDYLSSLETTSKSEAYEERKKLYSTKYKEKESFKIIENNEPKIGTRVDREELERSKMLFINRGKKKDKTKFKQIDYERDNSKYINTTAKVISNNNQFAPLQLKKFSSR